MGLNETYEPINAVVSSEAFIDFDLTYKLRFFYKRRKAVLDQANEGCA